MVRDHADGLQLVAGEHVRFVDGEDDVAVALVGFGGECCLDLGDEVGGVEAGGLAERSEEHTSELQSPCNLVCRLLLEKKKNNLHCVRRKPPTTQTPLIWWWRTPPLTISASSLALSQMSSEAAVC